MKFAALKSVTHVSILTSDMVSKNSINWSAFHFNINYGSDKGGVLFKFILVLWKFILLRSTLFHSMKYFLIGILFAVPPQKTFVT